MLAFRNVPVSVHIGSYFEFEGGHLGRVKERVLRVDQNDPLVKARISAFTQALADLGWIDGRGVRMDVRWYGDDNNRIRALAQELVGLQPDIILSGSTAATVALQRETPHRL